MRAEGLDQPVRFDQGPYLLVAAICEKVLVEADGANTLVRIIDRITRSPEVENLGDPMEPFAFPATIFIVLKAGIARGSYTLRVAPVKPSGGSGEPFTQTIYFEGDEDRGVGVAIKTLLQCEVPGIHWFEIWLDEVRLTKIPWRVVYTPQLRPRRAPLAG